ncbi:MAG: hypothetical protein U0237_06340 [Thermoleophilia bacterium]
MNERQIRELLGNPGANALTTARSALAQAHPEAEELVLTWAGWTAAEWNFTFVQRTPPRRLAVHVPHDGSEVTIRALELSDRPGAGPLAG